MNSNYFSGGLAEIISSPSRLTYSFLADWITGKKSLGKAMQIMNLPYCNYSEPILELHGNELLVNCQTEEQTLYQETIFGYRNNNDIRSIPRLSIKPRKIFSAKNWRNTIKILLIQADWIQNKQKITTAIERLLKNIPEITAELELNEIDKKISSQILPAAITIGMLAEFYAILVQKEFKNEISQVQQYITAELRSKDWFYLSLSDRLRVKNKEITFKDYLEIYGLRSDKDYELTLPRWYETPEKIQKQISQMRYLPAPEQQVENYASSSIDMLVELTLARSEAKKKMLPWIYALRQSLLKKTGVRHLSEMTRRDFFSDSKYIIRKAAHRQEPTLNKSGKGIPVSPGKASGKIIHFRDISDIIPPGQIAVFPSASPEYSLLFPACTGMIFLRGGMTSHGSIVAREFHIPAIIAPDAISIKDGETIKINGETGEWQIGKLSKSGR